MKKTKTILLLSLGLLFGVGVSTACSYPVQVKAAEINEEIVDDEHELKETLQKYWDEFIAPLFVGVTGTSIVSAILSIGIAIVNRKNNKASKEEVVKSHQNVNDVVLKATEMITSFNRILKAVEAQNTISQEMKTEFINASNQLLEKIATLTNKTEDLMKLKQIIVTQATINSKIALASKEVVTSGVGEDIKSLAEQIKQL